jgi:hypothetical protein
VYRDGITGCTQYRMLTGEFADHRTINKHSIHGSFSSESEGFAAIKVHHETYLSL